MNIERQPKRFKKSTVYSNSKKYDLYVGSKYGECTVLSFPGFIDRADHKTSRIPAALVECSCGKNFITNWYHLKNGRVPSCGHINGNYKEDPTESACNDLMCKYKHSAKVRNLVFDLTYEQFRTLTSKPCYYCGIKPKQERNCKNCQGSYIYNGIDRKDPSLGYIHDNCLPCCAVCNRAKSDMSFENYKKYIQRLVEFASTNYKIKSGKNGES